VADSQPCWRLPLDDVAAGASGVPPLQLRNNCYRYAPCRRCMWPSHYGSEKIRRRLSAVGLARNTVGVPIRRRLPSA
jgi:hypothetical protein